MPVVAPQRLVHKAVDVGRDVQAERQRGQQVVHLVVVPREHAARPVQLIDQFGKAGASDTLVLLGRWIDAQESVQAAL
jgi:hypothetical protein